MSRRPSRYIPHPPSIPIAVPRAYYLQDDADFSDGELEPHFAWTETEGPNANPQVHENMGNPADVTELYRRKPEEHYLISQEVVMPEEPPRYYYRPAALARLPQRRLPIAITPSSHGPGGPPPMQHPGAYYTPPVEEPRVQYDGILYRSSPHLQRIPPDRTLSPNARVLRRPHQAMGESSSPVNNIVRSVRPSGKPPVSVPTPRFYRRASLYKRPSHLCLQLPSTPDPSTRPVRSRLPSTMPGLTLPPLGLRSVRDSHFPPQPTAPQRTSTIIERARDYEDHSPRNRRILTARSAPPRCTEELLQERGMAEYGDEYSSNQGETEPKCSELELLLNRYEQTFRNNMEQSTEMPRPQTSRRSSMRCKTKRKTSLSRFAGLLKPRLPPSLKEHQKRVSSKQALTSAADEDRLEIEQMTAEVLDNLLHDLSAGGLVGDNQTPRSSSDVKKTESRTGSKMVSRQPSRPVSRVESRVGSKTPSRTMSTRVKKDSSCKDVNGKKSNKNLSAKKSGSFNFKKMKQTDSFEEIPTKTTFMQDKDKFSKFTNSSHTSFEHEKLSSAQRSREQSPFSPEQEKEKLEAFKKELAKSSMREEHIKKTQSVKKGKNDEHTALELHRSKSYIINLIDRALSRELGTIPEERPSKQYVNMDARTAMNMISSENMDTDMCIEITQAIADSFSSISKQQHQCSSKKPDSARSETKEAELMFSAGTEEPLYIKLLKKLRWGHLMHIQREMRRLLDLERFLDSCGTQK